MVQGCCSYGAHFVDEDDANAVLGAADRLTDEQWQHRRRRCAGAARSGGTATAPWSPALVGDACIFLNRPGFPGGAGCALHRGALDAGERPLDWKPDVCWQLPLRLVEATDDAGQVTSTLREWKRRDWGEGGHEFHWWCTERARRVRGRGPGVRDPARRDRRARGQVGVRAVRRPRRGRRDGAADGDVPASPSTSAPLTASGASGGAR